MSYKYFDINNKEITQIDLQDKSKWCKAGEKIEEGFIRQFGEKLGLIINPEKKNNPYAPDLLNTKNGKLGDLKFQSTPFFKANSLYGIDPTYAVVFNWKDRNRYENNYPEIEIYYWVNWVPITFEMYGKKISVSPLSGIWSVDFPIFRPYLDTCPLHSYQQRVDDKLGNAKSSYVCDIRKDIFKQLL